MNRSSHFTTKDGLKIHIAIARLISLSNGKKTEAEYMETSEIKYKEIVGAVSRAINKCLEIEMTCVNDIVEK